MPYFLPQEQLVALKTAVYQLETLEQELPKGVLNPRDVMLARAGLNRMIAAHYILNAVHGFMLIILAIIVLRLFDKNPDLWFGNKLLLSQLGLWGYEVNFVKRNKKYSQSLVAALASIGVALDGYNARRNQNNSR